MIPFKTQISWVEESELLDTELEDDFTIGMIYRGHANFSDILESVLERNPDAKFHFWSRTVEVRLINQPFLGLLSGWAYYPGEFYVVATSGPALSSHNNRWLLYQAGPYIHGYYKRSLLYNELRLWWPPQDRP